MENRPIYKLIDDIYFGVYYWILCNWGVTSALHSPLMAVTNAISGGIIVGALIVQALMK